MIDGFMFFHGNIFVRSDNTNGIDGLRRITCECEEWREIAKRNSLRTIQDQSSWSDLLLLVSQAKLERSHTAKRPQRPLALVYCLVDR